MSVRLKKTWCNWVTLWSKLFRHVVIRYCQNRWMTKEWGMGKVFILLGIRVITRGRVRWRRGGGGRGCSEHVKGEINHQLQKFTPLELISWVTVLYFTPPGEGEKRRGPMPLELSLLFNKLPPKVRLLKTRNVMIVWHQKQSPQQIITKNHISGIRGLPFSLHAGSFINLRFVMTSKK